MKRTLCVTLLLALTCSAWGQFPETPHQLAATCRLQTALSQECWNNCVNCHPEADPILPLDIYAGGDVAICERCHPEQTIPSSGTRLLQLGGGGGARNHPVSIFYRPEESIKGDLAPVPVGPRLFADPEGDNPKVYCSTCHDSMSNTPDLLRVNNRGSALCFACHRK